MKFPEISGEIPGKIESKMNDDVPRSIVTMFREEGHDVPRFNCGARTDDEILRVRWHPDLLTRRTKYKFRRAHHLNLGFD